MIPNTLVFIFTNHCNFVCDHCSVCAGPKESATIPEPLMKAAIDQAFNIPTIRSIVFTGGEATLYLDQLKTGIKQAHDRGFSTRVVSNAWWAGSYEKALTFLQDLVACGLNELNVSYDDFHTRYLAKYGGEQNIVNAVRAGLELGLNMIIGMVLQPECNINSTYLRQVFKAAGVQGDVKYLEDYVFPLGRARRLLPSSAFVQSKEEVLKAGCRDVGQTLVVLPDGKVSFCCGHALFTEAQDLFMIDSLASGVTLDDMIDRMQRNVLAWMLHFEGPQGVFDELELEKAVYKNCEACFYLGTGYKKKLYALAARKEEIFERYENGNLNQKVNVG